MLAVEGSGGKDEGGGPRLPQEWRTCPGQVVKQRFTDLLGRLTFDDEVLERVREALDVGHTDEKREHQEAIRRLQAENDRAAGAFLVACCRFH